MDVLKKAIVFLCQRLLLPNWLHLQRHLITSLRESHLFSAAGMIVYFFVFVKLVFVLLFSYCGQVSSFSFFTTINNIMGFSGGSDSKASTCNAGDPGSIPGLERSPGEGNGNLLQYFCLGNSMDRGAWQAPVHGVAKSRT